MKQHTQRMGAWMPVFALTLSLILSGCLFSPKDEPTPPPPDGGLTLLPQTSIGNLMANLKAVYEAKNYDEYAKLFNHVEFEFEFDATDIQENPEIPASWGWDEESEANKNMFQNEFVTSIELDFQIQTPREANESDLSGLPDNTWLAVASEVALRVTVQDPSGGEDTIYRVDGDRAQFFVLQNPDVLQDGDPVWEIIHWRDEVVGGSGDGLLAVAGN